MPNESKGWAVADRITIAAGVVSLASSAVAKFAEGVGMVLAFAIGLAIFTCLMILKDKYPETFGLILRPIGLSPTDTPVDSHQNEKIGMLPRQTNSVIAYQPPHNPYLPVWLALSDFLDGGLTELKRLDAEQSVLVDKIQLQFAQLVGMPETEDVPASLDHDLAQWTSNAYEAEALINDILSSREAIGIRSVNRSTTPFDIEAQLQGRCARRYHRFRDEVNLWNTKVAQIIKNLETESRLNSAAIAGEARRLLASVKK